MSDDPFAPAFVSHVSHANGVRTIRSRALGQCHVSMREKPFSEFCLRVLVKGLFQHGCARSIHVTDPIMRQRESPATHQDYEK